MALLHLGSKLAQAEAGCGGLCKDGQWDASALQATARSPAAFSWLAGRCHVKSHEHNSCLQGAVLRGGTGLFLLQHPQVKAGTHARCVTATPGSLHRYWWRNGYWTGSCYACGVWVGPANSNYPSCPSCQYYDPNQGLCVTVDDCPNN